MACSLPAPFTHARLYHQMALQLVAQLPQGEESVVDDVMRRVVFSGDLLRETLEESAAVWLDEVLQLREEQYLVSAGHTSVRRSKAELLKDTQQHLKAVQATYMQSMAAVLPRLEQSRARHCSPLAVTSLLSGDVGELLLPVDWVFLPLVEIYSMSIIPARERGMALEPSQVESCVVNTLRWVHLLETKLPKVLSDIRLSLKLSRLLCVFLTSSDLFLEPDVHAYLLSLLKLYCRPATLDRLDLEEAIPGLTAFYDLYMLLITQFDAVSFGDPLFAAYVILPLQQRHLVKYRRAIWGEFSTVLGALTLKLDQVVIPLERFLSPEETHVPLVRLYFQALFSSLVTHLRTPLPYVIAVHHVNRFCYSQDGANVRLKHAMLAQFLASSNQVLRRHVVFYKRFDESSPHGLDLYEELPKNRQTLVDKLKR